MFSQTDARFVAVYTNGNGVPPDTPSNPDTTLNPTTSQGTGSTPSTTDASQATDSGESTPNSDSLDASGDPAKSSVKGNSTAQGVASSPSGSSNKAESGSYYPADPSQPRSSRKGGSNSSTTNTVSTSSSGNTAIFVGVGGGVAAFLVAICLWGCVVKRRRRRDSDIETKYNSLVTPHDSRLLETATPVIDSYLDNDVRNDKALIPFRIEQSDLQLGERISQNTSTAVYKSTFQDGDVAVKQLLPGAWEHTAKLAQFMDEIRTCADLEHRKIIAFVGISWRSVRDLAVVMELMPLGDLSTLLQNQQDLPTAQDWSRPWTSMHIKSKTSIAQDVAEAVVYLHSFSSPILHRNLKARNVLLDSEGNAKLSGFGISRESSLDDTMTGEIGTTAWMAPEVLRGGRYDETADIYSLGVLMVEMDRCAHPYASEPALWQINDGHQPAAPTQRVGRHVAYTNTQIAILVSSGKLRPSVSNDCPASVASIVNECLSFDASSRPTSMEVFYRLRQARNAFKQQE